MSFLLTLPLVLHAPARVFLSRETLTIEPNYNYVKEQNHDRDDITIALCEHILGQSPLIGIGHDKESFPLSFTVRCLDINKAIYLMERKHDVDIIRYSIPQIILDFLLKGICLDNFNMTLEALQTCNSAHEKMTKLHLADFVYAQSKSSQLTHER